MRAIVIARPNKIGVAEVEGPACGPDDVIVRSAWAGICRTDVKILRGEMPASLVRYPCVPGHEWSGTVVRIGSNVPGLSLGARVVSEGRVPCGTCYACRMGKTNLCARYDQLGFTRRGGFGELVAVPARLIHRLPDHVAAEAGVLVEPASCVLRGLERVGPVPGEAIGVVGIGALGSVALLLARAFNPRAVVAYGIRPEELAFALRLGADLVINAQEPRVEEETQSVLGGLPDVVIEAAGSAQAMEMSTRIVRPGGRVALLGVAEGAVIEMAADRFVRKDIGVVGSLSYTTSTWTRMLDLLEARVVDLQPIVTHRFPLDRFGEAFSLLEQRHGIVGKIVLQHRE